jgi:hypothetical protein
MMTRVPFADPTPESDESRPDELQSQSQKPVVVNHSKRTGESCGSAEQEHGQSDAPEETPLNAVGRAY